MKRFVSLTLLLCILFGFSACTKHDANPQKILNAYEKVVEACGRTQMTKDKDLIGNRVLKEDAYVGTYLATSEHANGRDVVFGGGSLKERKVDIHGTIQTTSGKATLCVRLGEKKEEVATDENGNFHALLEMSSGGNYIMLDYENFEGTVKLYANYEEAQAQNI